MNSYTSFKHEVKFHRRVHHPYHPDEDYAAEQQARLIAKLVEAAVNHARS